MSDKVTGGKADAKCPEAEDVKISFASSANAKAVTDTALRVLREICAKACQTSATITSTARSVEDQARIMYDNIGRDGVASQRRLYAAAGDLVIDVYEAEKKKKSSRSIIEAAMVGKINELGPANVSNHLAQGAAICTIDVAPSTILEKNRAKFLEEAAAHPNIVRLLQPPNDPAYHLEVRN